MEDQEEIKIKSVKVLLPFDLLLKRVVKRNLLDFKSEEEILKLEKICNYYNSVKSAIMWQTRGVSPEAINDLNLAGIKAEDVKYITIAAFNPVITIDPEKSAPLEKFIFSEFVSSLRVLSTRIVREEARNQKFEIYETASTGVSDFNYMKIGIIKTPSGYLPYGSGLVANLWLKK